MSGSGAVWGRVRSRLRAFPERLAACGTEVRSRQRGGKGCTGRGGARRLPGSGGGVYRLTGGRKGRRDPRPSPSCPQAAAYGRCVQASTAPGGRLTKDLCAQEFEALRRCFAAAVSGRRPRRGGGHPGFGVGRRQVLRTRHTRSPASATPAATASCARVHRGEGNSTLTVLLRCLGTLPGPVAEAG